MAAKIFTTLEWKQINDLLDNNPDKYGFPKRIYGSVVIGSFNIRKLGSATSRNKNTWEFIAKICQQFDLLAIQEIMDNMDGIRKLMTLLGDEFGLIISDKTGTFPGEPGVGERLGFIFRWAVVTRTEVATDITYDRSKVLGIINNNFEELQRAFTTYNAKLAEHEAGRRRTKPKLKMPVFLSFIRQPFCVSFEIKGHSGTAPYQFMAINAHLYFGNYIQDRRDEFNALMEWILGRVRENDRAYYPNFMLLGDLNLDFDNPDIDYPRISHYMKTLNDGAGEQVNVNFPFLDIHKDQTEHFTTTARLGQTFDQIGLFFRESGLPTFLENSSMGEKERGPDYGVFNFTILFQEALGYKKLNRMNKEEKKAFFARFEHKVSDHMPIWMRLPLPD